MYKPKRCPRSQGHIKPILDFITTSNHRKFSRQRPFLAGSRRTIIWFRPIRRISRNTTTARCRQTSILSRTRVRGNPSSHSHLSRRPNRRFAIDTSMSTTKMKLKCPQLRKTFKEFWKRTNWKISPAWWATTSWSSRRNTTSQGSSYTTCTPPIRPCSSTPSSR